MYEPGELETVEREEREARMRLAEAHERKRMDEGEAPAEHDSLIHELEDEWKRLRDRLHEMRGGDQG